MERWMLHSGKPSQKGCVTAPEMWSCLHCSWKAVMEVADAAASLIVFKVSLCILPSSSPCLFLIFCLLLGSSSFLCLLLDRLLLSSFLSLLFLFFLLLSA